MRLIPNAYSKTVIYFLIILLIGGISCSTLEQLSSLQKPTLKVTDAQITGLSLQDMEITFDVEVDNPNPLAADFQDYEYDLQLNDRSFISGQQNMNTSIAPDAISTVQVPVAMRFIDLYSSFSEIRSQDETNYLFAFNAGVQVPTLGRIELPFEYSGSFPNVKLPSFSFSSLTIESLSLTKAVLNLNVDIQNPNVFDINLSGLDYAIDLNGLSPFSGSIDRAISVPGKTSGEVAIPVEVNILQLGSAARDILVDGKQIEYSFSGSTRVGSSLPVFEQSIFNFDKDGVVDILR